MKRFLLAVLMLLTTVSLTACSGTSETSETCSEPSEASGKTDSLEDGETRVRIDTEYFTCENGEIRGTAQIMAPVVLSDKVAENLKEGDIIHLEGYGLGQIPVETIERKENCLNLDYVMLVRKDEYDGWIIVGTDDDVASYVEKDVYVSISNDTEMDDQMGQIVFEDSKHFSNVWDAFTEYAFFDAILTVKDGITQKVDILYHP